ncbi:GGDEF domain-containing protein [Sulfurovum sp.]|uniref:GGDEF domain-containing protein n=1 Tax=Sulfurovum sp. TaxID=1969726 RepID=UPI0025DC8C8F|nr:GGDEF domain-containing protein [Sulfurovum sp.]
MKNTYRNSITQVGTLSSKYKLDSPSVKDSKLLRQKYILKAISLLAMACTIPLGLLALSKGQNPLSFILLSVGLLSVLNYFLTLKNKISYALASAIAIYPIVLLMLYLVAYGGVNNTGALWIYALPAVVLFLHGFKKGLMILSIFLLGMVMILFVADTIFLHAVYTFDYKIRLILVFILDSALTAAYEYSTENLFGKMKLLTEELATIAEEDQLTQLRNRRGVHHEMERVYEQTKRDDTHMSLIMCDIDYFKDVNDRYGHDAGDQVLIEVANVIKNTIRKTDIAARWGGEEFLVVLPKTNEKEAYLVAEKIRKNILDILVEHEKYQIKVSLSAGVADNKYTSSIEGLIKLADSYMYEAKTRGRNLTCPKMLY